MILYNGTKKRRATKGKNKRKQKQKQTTLAPTKRRKKPISFSVQQRYDMKAKIGEPYGNVCFVCGKRHTPRGMLVVHHLWYLPGEKTYKDFTSKSTYLTYLKRRTEEMPERFLLLCNAHHQSVERLKRFNDRNFDKLVEAVRKTRT